MAAKFSTKSSSRSDIGWVSVLCIVAALLAAAVCSSGCYLSRWSYSPYESEENFHGWFIRLIFVQETWSAPPETDKGDTAFVLSVNYRCIDTYCSTNLEVSNPRLIRRDDTEGKSLDSRFLYESKQDSVFSLIELGPWPLGKAPDTVTIEFDLVAKDKGTGESIETRRMRVVGFPTNEKTGLIRAMVRGV